MSMNDGNDLLSSVSRGQQSITICEGTGHVGVGSVVGANNARVAAELGADVVLVANGGLGRAFDELEINRSLCLVSMMLDYCNMPCIQLYTFHRLKSDEPILINNSPCISIFNSNTVHTLQA